MPGAKRGRQFGNIRKLSSGRYQARYRGPDGKLRPAPSTFQRKNDAARWLSLKEAEISRGEWIAPELGAQAFREYAGQWLRDRVLKARTRPRDGATRQGRTRGARRMRRAPMWHPCGTYVARQARDHHDRPEPGVRRPPMTCTGIKERATGIEPA